MTVDLTFHILEHLLSIFSFILALVLFSRILSERNAPGSTLAWLIGMVTIPYLVVPLYLLIGDRKVKRVTKAKGKLTSTTRPSSFAEGTPAVEKILLSSGFSKPTTHNQLEFLFTGEKAFDAILDSIHSAQHSIQVITFILGDDKVALQEKAEQGIQVQLLLDGVGSFWFPTSKLKALKKAGGKIVFFLPFFRFPFPGWSHLRNHRKMILIDQKRAIIGGMNLSQAYIGPTPNSKRWSDLSVLIQGEAVPELERLFQSDWEYASKEEANPVLLSKKEPRLTGSVGIQIIPSGPDVSEDTLYDVLLTAIYTAQKRIWIVTPYFIPDEALSRALELACRRGIDVRILVPKKSDHFLADLCRKTYLRQIHHEGGHLHFFGPNMMHAKVTVVDDQFAIVGSANFDMRSLFLNYEVGVLLSSEEVIEPIIRWFYSLQEKCQPGKFKKWFGSDLVEGVGRVIGPLL